MSLHWVQALKLLPALQHFRVEQSRRLAWESQTQLLSADTQQKQTDPGGLLAACRASLPMPCQKALVLYTYMLSVVRELWKDMEK